MEPSREKFNSIPQTGSNSLGRRYPHLMQTSTFVSFLFFGFGFPSRVGGGAAKSVSRSGGAVRGYEVRDALREGDAAAADQPERLEGDLYMGYKS